MPLEGLLCAPSPALAAFCGIGGASTRSPHTKKDWAAGGGRLVTISVAVGELLLRRPRGAPIGSHDAVSSAIAAARTQQHAALLSVQGKMRTALLRGANHKRWVAQSSNSEQGQEISEGTNIQSSEDNSGPPVLTIIAGLLVLFLVFWALGSLVSWIVGLIFKS